MQNRVSHKEGAWVRLQLRKVRVCVFSLCFPFKQQLETNKPLPQNHDRGTGHVSNAAATLLETTTARFAWGASELPDKQSLGTGPNPILHKRPTHSVLIVIRLVPVLKNAMCSWTPDHWRGFNFSCPVFSPSRRAPFASGVA